MSRNELRKKLLERENAAGNAQTEMEELKKVQKNKEDITTITVGCSTVLTLICCA